MQAHTYSFIILWNKYPDNEPNIAVIMIIGISDIGSFHPIINKLGISTKNDITNPFKIPFNPKEIMLKKYPIINHIENADKFASQVNF